MYLLNLVFFLICALVIFYICIIFRQLDETFVTGILSFVPILADIAPEWSGYNNLLRTVKTTSSFFQSVVTEHEKSITEGDPRDYIDAYLEEIRNSKDNPNSSFSKDKGRKDIFISSMH